MEQAAGPSRSPGIKPGRHPRRPYETICFEPQRIEKGTDRFNIREDKFPPVLATWRNNLTALSQRHNIYFVGCSTQVHVFEPTPPGQTIRGDPIIIINPVMKDPSAQGYISTRVPHAINRILVDDIGRDEILLLATDSGNVTGYRTQHILKAIQDTKAERQKAKESGRKPGPPDVDVSTFFSEFVGISAWGLAIHKYARLIAVGANTTDITVFAFALADEPESSSGDEDDSFDLGDDLNLQSQDWMTIRHPQDLEELGLSPDRRRSRNLRLILEGHYTNIPNIAFLNSDLDLEGNWLVSVDIENRLMVWNIWEQKYPVNQYDFTDSRVEHRGWNVLALDPRTFRQAKTRVEACGGRPVQMDRSRGDLDISHLIKSVPDSSQEYTYFPPEKSDNGEESEGSFDPGDPVSITTDGGVVEYLDHAQNDDGSDSSSDKDMDNASSPGSAMGDREDTITITATTAAPRGHHLYFTDEPASTSQTTTPPGDTIISDMGTGSHSESPLIVNYPLFHDLQVNEPNAENESLSGTDEPTASTTHPGNTITFDVGTGFHPTPPFGADTGQPHTGNDEPGGDEPNAESDESVTTTADQHPDWQADEDEPQMDPTAFLQLVMHEAFGGEISGLEDDFEEDPDEELDDWSDNEAMAAYGTAHYDDDDDDEDDNHSMGSEEGGFNEQTALYNIFSALVAEHGLQDSSQEAVAAQEQPPSIEQPPSFLEFPILYFSDTDIRLLTNPFAVRPSLVCRKPFEQPFSVPILSIHSCDRINMVHSVPELGIVIAATQKGRVAVITLTHVKSEGLPYFRVDWIAPFESQEKFGHRPLCPLLGMAVGPVPSQLIRYPSDTAINQHEEMKLKTDLNDTDDEDVPESDEHNDPKGKGKQPVREKKSHRNKAAVSHLDYTNNCLPEPWRHNFEYSRRYRLMLYYSDHTIMSYQFYYDWPRRMFPGIPDAYTPQDLFLNM